MNLLAEVSRCKGVRGMFGAASPDMRRKVLFDVTWCSQKLLDVPIMQVGRMGPVTSPLF